MRVFISNGNNASIHLMKSSDADLQHRGGKGSGLVLPAERSESRAEPIIRDSYKLI